MADPGFVSGFIGKGIDIAIRQILHHANIALQCRKELQSLRDLVMSIQPMATKILQYRLELNRKRGTSVAKSHNNASEWVTKLHDLLGQALAIAQNCRISRFDVFSRYQTSRRISSLISQIQKHLQLVPLVLLEQQTQMHTEMLRESTEASTSTSVSTSKSLAPTGSFFIEEARIVGQEEAFNTLEKLAIDAQLKSLFRIGVVGKGGSGKTLLLKTLFNSQKVRDLFRDDLLLWLTVSQSPSFPSLRNELCKQIAMQAKEVRDKDMSEEDVKKWLSQRMVESKNRFALFLDDVWGEGGKLMEELGLSKLGHHPDYRIIVSSRNRRALFQMGVAEVSIITIGDLSEEKSWELFAIHAFPYNNGIPPANIGERRAKPVCDKCGGLPLAIKVIGRTMAAITDAREWDLAIHELPNANSEDRQALHERLRWSYDALGNYDVNLQLCFLYLAAFKEDQIIDVRGALIPLWLGEGLLERSQRGYDPLGTGIIYANQLMDRCLIEPVLKDMDGCVIVCRMHDVLHSLAIQIAEQEENFYCRAGNGLTALAENECSRHTRLLLNDNELESLPKSFRARETCSLLMVRNNVAKIPRKVIGSMISLKVLDLSGTSIKSLPKSVGCLKQLVCLRLRVVPIKSLPAAITDLASLRIIDLYGSGITELPAGIHKLTSLMYLDISRCDNLQYLPSSISRLTSLQHLAMSSSSIVWRKHGKRKVASINDLGSLTQLKRLYLKNDGAETIREGTLGRMLQMETLGLNDSTMQSLPHDMTAMSKLKGLWINCNKIVKMDSRFCEFQNLSGLQLWGCERLKEVSYLQSLQSLKKLYIWRCSQLKKFPDGFGEKGAFPLLEAFALVELDELEELPILKEGAMPLLKVFTIMKCEALKMLPENYLHFKDLQKLRVFGCSMVLENIERIKIWNTKVEVVTMSTIETEENIEKNRQICNTYEIVFFSEILYNEFLLFMEEIYKVF